MTSDAIADPYLALVDIDAGTLSLRLVADHDTVTYGGTVYQPWPLRVTFGATGPDRQPSAVLELSNVSQSVASALRAISEPPSCVLRVARMGAAHELVTHEGEVVTYLGDPVTYRESGNWGVAAIEREYGEINIVSVDFSASVAGCRLGPKYDWSRERFPPIRHDGRFKGLSA